MMDNEEQFFNGIEDTLHAYEEAYVPGAWEAFQQKRKRRRMAVLFFRIGSAAAVLLLFCYVAMQFFAAAPKPVQVAQTKVDPRQPENVQPQPGVKSEPSTLQSQHKKSSTEKNIVYQKPVYGEPSPLKIPAYQEQQINKPFTQNAPALKPIITQQDNVVAAVADAPVNNNIASQPAQKPAAMDNVLTDKPVTDVATGPAIAQNQPKKTPVTRSIYDSLVNSKTNRPVADVVKKNGKNLTYSVVVSPAVGNQKMNFGTGVEVAYKLTDNLSINSGVAYSSLNAATSGSNSPTASSSRQVQGVNLQVSGFEVPIGLQYRTGGGYYVSAGIVGMSVMNNRLQYDYTAQNTFATASYSNVAGMQQEVLRVSTEQKTEDSKEKVKNVLGFYMLSVGKKKALGNGNSQLNFGPFVRIPFGAVSSENIRLMQGGVRLGFDF